MQARSHATATPRSRLRSVAANSSGVWLPSPLRERMKDPIEQVGIGGRTDLTFRIDILICDRATGRPLWVLDAKYKTPDAPAAVDIAQIVAYAEAIGCRRAALVYPAALGRPVAERVGGIAVRSLVCDVSGSLEEGGSDFLRSVLSWDEMPRGD